MRTARRQLMAWILNSKGSIELCIREVLAGVVTDDSKHVLELYQHPDGARTRKADWFLWIAAASVYLLILTYGLYFEHRYGDLSSHRGRKCVFELVTQVIRLKRFEANILIFVSRIVET